MKFYPDGLPVLKFETFNEDYVSRLKSGDAEAGAHFATYFGSVLFLKLRTRLRSVQLIEDVRQETLARVLIILREGEGVRRPDRFGAFVNAVCNNVIREFCRLDSRHNPLDEHVEEPIDSSIDLDAELANDDLKREIQNVLATLSKKDRAILIAVYIDEKDKAEVCRNFGVEPGYLRVLIHRAKKQCREAWRHTHRGPGFRHNGG